MVLNLKSYEFKKYKSKKEKRIITLSVMEIKINPQKKLSIKFKALEEGIFYTRDLVSEARKYIASR